MALTRCRECGKEISDQAVSCPGCGCPMTRASQPAVQLVRPVKSKGTAIVLAIFLGGVGAHKFYLGRYFQGILYLMFCVTFVPAIIALLEAIAYASMSEAQFQHRYCGAMAIENPVKPSALRGAPPSAVAAYEAATPAQQQASQVFAYIMSTIIIAVSMYGLVCYIDKKPTESLLFTMMKPLLENKN